MKTIMTILLGLFMTVTFAQIQQESGLLSPPDKPQTFVEVDFTNLPAAKTLPESPREPEGSRNGLVFYYDRANFDADHPGLPVEDFENSSIPSTFIFAMANPLDQFTNNTYINPGDILPGIQFLGSIIHAGDEIALLGVNTAGSLSKTAVANYFADNYRILFNPPVHAAGMDVQDFLGGILCDVDIYDENGILVGTDVSACSPAGAFWGVASGNLIGEIRIKSRASGAEGADNIAFGTSEPIEVPISSYALIIGALLMVAFVVIRLR